MASQSPVVSGKNVDQSKKWSGAKVLDRSVLGEETAGRWGFSPPLFHRAFIGLTRGQTASIAVHSPAPETGQSQLQFAYEILQQIHPCLWYLQ